MPIEKSFTSITDIRKDSIFLNILASTQSHRCYIVLIGSQPSFLAIPYDVSEKVAREFNLSSKTITAREIYRSSLNGKKAKDMENKFDLIQGWKCHYSFIPYSDDRMKFVEGL